MNGGGIPNHAMDGGPTVSAPVWMTPRQCRWCYEDEIMTFEILRLCRRHFDEREQALRAARWDSLAGCSPAAIALVVEFHRGPAVEA